ncbi:hypothetical protein C440_06472 [Haloferax mucosum ATCC BAA-1512]|uniref:Uncharacterized protein n=1 Tax=Haloferax mucosum ATCC BAA-1512 TaxID=662479 RepID=M0IJ72_9EURY|nr:hypothetical protein [Haloferax mucosum]ELZ95913.1 hypothetical protein C440_06472 [Haloferax mucosum ATCC BAA-1512]
MTQNTQPSYDGDVTLNGSEQPPVELRDPADVFVGAESIDGDLTVQNAEYVFTHSPVTGSNAVADAETEIAGTIEDGYVQSVPGDVLLSHAEDVFISADAVDGTVSAPGAENVYSDDTSLAADADSYDVSTFGWEQSGRATDPEAGVYAVGMSHDIELANVRRDVELYLVGHGHDVRVDGKGAEISIHFVGYDNTVHVGPYLSSTVETETGFDNDVDAEPYPAEDLVEMSRSEAYSNAGFGRTKVTFQVPHDGDDWCSNCGQAAEAIIERHQLEAFFLFGHPVWTFDQSTNPAHECEHCSPNAIRAELTERERRTIFD